MERDKCELSDAFELKQASLEKLSEELAYARKTVEHHESSMAEYKHLQEKIKEIKLHSAKVSQLNEELQKEVMRLKNEAVSQVRICSHIFRTW